MGLTVAVALGAGFATAFPGPGGGDATGLLGALFDVAAGAAAEKGRTRTARAAAARALTTRVA